MHPSPSFRAWYAHQMSGVLGIMSNQTYTAQWKSVKIYGHLPQEHETQPSMRIEYVLGDHAASVCVWVAVRLHATSMSLVHVLCFYYQNFDVGENLYFFYMFLMSSVWFAFRYEGGKLVS